MFAGIVVIDFRVLADACRHLVQALFGHGQGGQGAGPGPGVFEHRADPRQGPGHLQVLQAVDDLGFAAAQGLGHGPIGLGAQRQAMLELIDQAPGQ
ncbi:hypothetical protein D3C84_747840 [compost metagenome]